MLQYMGYKESNIVKFYLGQNDDCSPGDSTSVPRDCSKEAGGEMRL